MEYCWGNDWFLDNKNIQKHSINLIKTRNLGGKTRGNNWFLDNKNIQKHSINLIKTRNLGGKTILIFYSRITV